MNISVRSDATYFFSRTKYLVLCALLIAFSIGSLHAQNKKKTLIKGGQKPNTGNRKLKTGWKFKGNIPPNVGDIRDISLTGENRRFPSNQDATTLNPMLGKTTREKKSLKTKQAVSINFRGTEQVKKHPHHINPRDEKERGNNTEMPNHQDYLTLRNKDQKAKESPHDKHKFQGDEVLDPKFIKFGAPLNVNHVNQHSAIVDHSKFQGYRTKAFEQREKNMSIVNAEGSIQYGKRPSGEFFDLDARRAMRAAKDKEHFSYSGNFNLIDKEADIRKKEKEIANNSGDIDLTARDKMRREKGKEVANYSGDIDLTARDKLRREKGKEQANYSGDIDLTARDKMRREKDKEAGNYSGDISMNDLMKKARDIRKKDKTVANYSGDILVKTLRERDNRTRMKAKKIANWEGDIVIAKKRKGAHPSAAYVGGKVANSYKQKEKYRKQMLKKYGRNPSMETPNYQRRKYSKPTYDKNEAQIWDVERYRETKTKEAP